jgi:hypothetical protein
MGRTDSKADRSATDRPRVSIVWILLFVVLMWLTPLVAIWRRGAHHDIQPVPSSEAVTLCGWTPEKERQQAVWRLQALRQFPALADLEAAGIYFFYDQGNAVLVNYCGRRHTTDDEVGALQNVPTLRTVSLETTSVSGKGLEHLTMLPQLEEVWLDSCDRIRDKDLEVLARLPKLRRLNLPFTNLGDGALDSLKGAPAIESLSLHATAVTDAGLRHLPSMKIRSLWLSYTKVTDASVPTLIRCSELRWLAVGGSRISKDGIKALQRARPDLAIAQ